MLVDPAGPRPGPRSPRTPVRHRGASEPSHVARETWSTPRAHGLRPESRGALIETEGFRTAAPIAGDSWLTMRTLESGPRSPRTSGRACRNSGTGPCFPGELVDPAGPRTRSRVAWECWSTLRALGHWTESPGTSGNPPGHRSQVQVIWASRTNPQAIGPEAESPGRAGRPRLHLDSSGGRQGELVDTLGPRTWA